MEDKGIVGIACWFMKGGFGSVRPGGCFALLGLE